MKTKFNTLCSSRVISLGILDQGARLYKNYCNGDAYCYNDSKHLPSNFLYSNPAKLNSCNLVLFYDGVWHPLYLAAGTNIAIQSREYYVCVLDDNEQWELSLNIHPRHALCTSKHVFDRHHTCVLCGYTTEAENLTCVPRFEAVCVNGFPEFHLNSNKTYIATRMFDCSLVSINPWLLTLHIGASCTYQQVRKMCIAFRSAVGDVVRMSLMVLGLAYLYEQFSRLLS
jgi:hypothetical protein